MNPAPARQVLLPGNPHLFYSDFVRMEKDPVSGRLRFDRALDMPGKGYRWDNPGARIRFRTDAAWLTASLHYSERHTSATGRNPLGAVIVDGQLLENFRFRGASRQVRRPPEDVEVAIPVPGGAGFHDYELVLPYGDSVEFAGLKTDDTARFGEPPPRPKTRCVCLGDSITHGFTASDITRAYPFLLGQAMNWQILNLGLGGRTARAGDGRIAASLQPDVVIILIGVNDWQGGRPPDTFRENMEGMLAGIRETRPDIPIHLLTPLWVSPAWKPAKAVENLERYRQVLREIAAARADRNLHLMEGPELIEHDAGCFDKVAVHPNDRGFAMMARRMAEKIKKIPEQ
jgi:lysophospholipase L1-like esterase